MPEAPHLSKASFIPPDGQGQHFLPRLRPHFVKLIRSDYVASGELHDATAPIVLDCALGVSPFGSPSLVDPAALLTRETIQNYPPFPYNRLKDRIAQSWSAAGIDFLNRRKLSVAAGSMRILDALCTLFIDPGDVVLGYSPQFPEFINSVRAQGGRYEGVPLMPESGHRFDPGGMLEALGRLRPALVYLDNPNNPTGQVIPLADIAAVVAAAASCGATVVVDEAYGDYMDPDQSAMTLLGSCGNLMVTRTFSKGYALAGLRVGYLAASETLIRAYAAVDDLLVNSAGIEAALAALDDLRHLPRTRALTRSVKEEVLAGTRGFTVPATDPDVPIFTLIHPDPATNLRFMLAGHGVAVTGGLDGLGPNAVRVRIPADPAPLTAVLAQLKKETIQ